MKRGISLRTFLVAPFLILFLSGIVLIGWISYQNWLASVHQFERRLSDEIGLRIQTNLQQYFNTASRLAHIDGEMLRLGELSPGNVSAQQRLFAMQLRQLPHLTAIGFGRADGLVSGARRAAEGNDIRLMAVDHRAAPLRIYSIGDDARPKDLLFASDQPYDVTEAGWFRQPVEAGAMIWIDPSRNENFDGLGYGVSNPIYGKNHVLLGVLGIYVAEEQLSRFLEESQGNERGLAFLVDENGKLLATSNKSSLFEMHGGNLHRYTVSESPDAHIAAAGRELARDARRGSRLMHFDGEDFLMNAIPYEGPDGMKLTIGVLLPESDFSGLLSANLRISLVLTLLATLVGVRFGISLTHKVSRPIEAINRYAGQLARGEWAGAKMPGSSVREIVSLANAFDAMAVSLQDMIDTLEARVAERTQALEEANDKLGRLASEDGLTGIANRRSFDEFLQREWSRAQREHKPVAMLLCDIDFFKAYNDHYGHHAGDAVLRQVAQIVDAHARRPLDLAARYGGEEFAVVLPATHLAGALHLATKLVAAVSAAGIVHERSSVSQVVTLSVGVAAIYPLHGEPATRLIQLADAELYHAKDRGRNQASPRLPSSFEGA